MIIQYLGVHYGSCHRRTPIVLDVHQRTHSGWPRGNAALVGLPELVTSSAHQDGTGTQAQMAAGDDESWENTTAIVSDRHIQVERAIRIVGFVSFSGQSSRVLTLTRVSTSATKSPTSYEGTDSYKKPKIGGVRPPDPTRHWECPLVTRSVMNPHQRRNRHRDRRRATRSQSTRNNPPIHATYP